MQEDLSADLTALAPEDRARVQHTLKRTLEGELVELASVPRIAQQEGAGHSKSHGPHGHSKSGHLHSKGQVAEDTALQGADNASYARFAERLLSRKSQIS